MALTDSARDFWVVAGAAAPIIALASQVALSEAYGLKGITYRARVGGTPTIRPYALRADRIAYLLFLISYMNMLVQAAVLLFSLVSLAEDQTAFPPLAVAGMAVAGLLALLIVAFMSPTVHEAAARLKAEASLPEEPPSPD